MRRLGAILAVLALVALAAAPLANAAEDPAALLEKLVEARNSHDVEAGLALFNDDAVMMSPGPTGEMMTYTGIDAIRKQGNSTPDPSSKIEIETPQVTGDAASANFKAYSDSLKQAGLEPGIGVVEITAKDGKIQEFTVTYDEAWMAKAKAAMAAMQTTAAAPEDPGALLKALIDAENSHDIDSIITLYNDDAVLTGPGDNGYQTYTGIDAIKKFETASNADVTFLLEIDEPKVDGDTATANFKGHAADLVKAGLDPAPGVVTLTAKNGKIQTLDVKFDEAWMAKANAAMASMQATPEAAGTPTAMGPGGTPEAMATGPGKLPSTGDASDPLPYALALGGLLLAGGFMLRRFGRAA